MEGVMGNLNFAQELFKITYISRKNMMRKVYHDLYKQLFEARIKHLCLESAKKNLFETTVLINDIHEQFHNSDLEEKLFSEYLKAVVMYLKEEHGFSVKFDSEIESRRTKLIINWERAFQNETEDTEKAKDVEVPSNIEVILFDEANEYDEDDEDDDYAMYS